MFSVLFAYHDDFLDVDIKDSPSASDNAAKYKPESSKSKANDGIKGNDPSF
ncbi:unnamed protein product, partial [Rotaria sp. Silwood1]